MSDLLGTAPRGSPIAEDLFVDCLLSPPSKTGINGIAAVGAKTVPERAAAGAESAAITREFDLSGVEEGSQMSFRMVYVPLWSGLSRRR